MHDVVTRGLAITRSSTIAAALILILAAGGCERSPSTGNDSKPLVRNSVTRTLSASDVPAAPSPATATAPADPSAQAAQPIATRPTKAPPKYIAYYFHRTIRCPTCLAIEKQSREAIELSYNGELSAGTLEWHAVNIEAPGNEHFEKDFALDRQALVLVKLGGEEVQRHKKLERVWELVEDPYGFQEYVVAEVGLFLGGD